MHQEKTKNQTIKNAFIEEHLNVYIKTHDIKLSEKQYQKACDGVAEWLQNNLDTGTQEAITTAQLQ